MIFMILIDVFYELLYMNLNLRASGLSKGQW